MMLMQNKMATAIPNMSNSGVKPHISSLIAGYIRAIQETYESLDGLDKDYFLMGFRTALHEALPSAMGAACIDKSVVDCIGRTKLVRLRKIQSAFYNENNEKSAEIVAKMEFTNPGQSVKDRIAKSMLLEAEREGVIQPGVHTIVDITSGNTGVGWGMVAASKGYDVVQIIPENFSIERRALMMAYGVNVKVSERGEGYFGALKVHRETMEELGEDTWVPLQFGNPSNIKAHYEHTGPEIWEQCGGRVDAIVAGYGTGGTLTGVTKFLRSKNPNFRCYAVEAMENSPLNGDTPSSHGIQGISPPFIPSNVEVDLVDEVIRCPTSEAMATARKLAKTEGIAVGISAGANVWAACRIASRPDMKGKRIVTILPSAAERYMSTNLYKDLMERAMNMPLTRFDRKTKIAEYMMSSMLSLESHKKAGTVFREGFRVE